MNVAGKLQWTDPAVRWNNWPDPPEWAGGVVLNIQEGLIPADLLLQEMSPSVSTAISSIDLRFRLHTQLLQKRKAYRYADCFRPYYGPSLTDVCILRSMCIRGLAAQSTCAL
jgi:hypothetical protein